MMGVVNTRIQLKRDTTENWNDARGFIPLAGEMIVYNDYEVIVKEIDGETKEISCPNIKIGDGQTYVQDLPFVNQQLREMLIDHINDYEVHVTLGEKDFWNNKINVDDLQEVIENTLVFNRR